MATVAMKNNVISKRYTADTETETLKKMKQQMRVQKVRIYKTIYSLLLTVCIIGSMAILFSNISLNAKASSDPAVCKYYKSVMVQNGDTLWKLAGEYSMPERESKEQFVNEVMKINHMSEDTLYSGAYIIVPYYEEVNLENSLE